MLDSTLSKDYLIQKGAESVLWSVFTSFGYSEVRLRANGQSVARELAANAKKSNDLRLCCSTLGSEADARYAAAIAKADTDSAMSEPIAATIEALIAFGIEDFYIKIGSSTFVKAICEEIDKDKAEALFCAAAAKNKKELAELLSGSQSEYNEILLKLDDVVGGETILERFDKLPKKADAALEKLEDVLMLLMLYGFEKFPVIDMSVISDSGYDDMYYEIYISNSDKPVCVGGTIDGCVTAEIDMGRLAELCGKDAEKMPKTLIYSEEDAEGIAYDIAFNLRINGCCVENYVDSGNFKAAEKFAKKAGADSMIRAFPDGRIMIKEFKDGTIVETTAEEFLGYYDEEDECDCGHEHGECGCGHHHH